MLEQDPNQVCGVRSRSLLFARRLLLPLAMTLGASGSAGAACLPAEDDGFDLVKSEDAVVAYRAVPEPVRIGSAFSLEIRLCTPGDDVYAGRLTGVDATMPSLGKRIKNPPKVSSTEPGQYRADGMVIPVPGRWEIRFDLDLDGNQQRLTHFYAVR